MNEEYQEQQGRSFASIILGKWMEVMQLSEQWRQGFMLGTPNLELTAEYISKMTRLWGALEPKVKGRTDLRQLEREFEAYRKYCYNPRALNEPENAEDIFKMEAIMEEVLDKLKITKFEYE